MNGIPKNAAEFTSMILRIGPDNIVFFVPLSRAGWLSSILGFSSIETVPARIVQSNHKVAEGYRIELEPLLPGYKKKAFHTSQLLDMLKSDGLWNRAGRSRMLVEVKI